MHDPRRVQVPWYLWRWRLSLLFPMLLFVMFAMTLLREFEAGPVSASVIALAFFGFAMLFMAQMWRERYPLHAEVRRRPRLNNRSF
jgi:hypothetical protein